MCGVMMDITERLLAIQQELNKYEIVTLNQDNQYLLRLVYPRAETNASPFLFVKLHKGFYIRGQNVLTNYECAGPNCGMCKMSTAVQAETGSDKYRDKKRYIYLLLAKGGKFKFLELDWFAQRAFLGIDPHIKTRIVEMMAEGIDPFSLTTGRPVIINRKSKNGRDLQYEVEGLGLESPLSESELNSLKYSSPDLSSFCYRPTVKESEEIAQWTWKKIKEKKGG